MVRFPLGQVVATPNALKLLQEIGEENPIFTYPPQVRGPREIVEARLGGPKDAYAETCQACAKVGATFQSEAPNWVT
jgi:hypothetical protein